jgi:CubicO group peptidase (beta-lactamase class C family)
MRLVAEGKVELDAPVRRYIPELRLADEQAAAKVTVLNLRNHTSGLGWDLLVDTGEGDDALARLVANLAELELFGSPGNDDLDLGSYHAFHATRADLLRRLGRHDDAREAYS